ncbi:MAG: threonine/serine exporter family protein [Bacteroidales bacterium]
MITFSFLIDILLDALFAALAAIGFAVISNPPRKAILISALLAAVGHGLRYFLMHFSLIDFNITMASFFAAFSIGLLAIPFARYIHCPVEVFTFPSLLPMIPGMFAYKTILSLTRFLHVADQGEAVSYMVSIFQNGLTTIFVLFALVLGATLPVFIFHRQSFSITRILRQ